MRKTARPRQRAWGDTSGFSLIELMVVVGIIFVLLAMALPQITSYMRTYRIRGGVRQTVDALQRARNVALKKNARYGVVFFVQNVNRVGYYSEDLFQTVDDAPVTLDDGTTTLTNIKAGQRIFARRSYPQATDAQESLVNALPRGIEFVPASAGTNHYARFDNLGRPCTPAASGNTGPCPAVVTTATANTPALALDTNGYLDASGSDTVIVLQDRDAPSVQMRVVIGPGGRIKRQAKDSAGNWRDDN